MLRMVVSFKIRRPTQVVGMDHGQETKREHYREHYFLVFGCPYRPDNGQWQQEDQKICAYL